MGPKEMAITPDGKNRIMIFGPETDGTYVVEFRTAEGKRCRSQYREAHAAWALRAGCSVRNLWRAR
jgi:hypothetical protein